jgi:hypothetical protein
MQAAPINAFMSFFFLFWCFGIVLGVAQLVMGIMAVIQAVNSKLPTEQKLLWALLAWFVPILGPILWWTVGSKSGQDPMGR